MLVGLEQEVRSLDAEGWRPFYRRKLGGGFRCVILSPSQSGNERVPSTLNFFSFLYGYLPSIERAK
jgi:hypothetical protein